MLAALRKRAGLTQEGLAYKAAVCRATVQKIEAGTGSIRPATAKKLANVLGVKWTVFFEDDAQKDKHAS